MRPDVTTVGDLHQIVNFDILAYHGFPERRAESDRPRLPKSIRPLFEMLGDFMLVHEPPKHTRLRTPVSRAFTPRVVEHILPDLEEYTDQLLDRALANGKFEATRDFIMPLSVRTMGALLGIPSENRRGFSSEFYKLQGTFMQGSSLEALERATQGSQRLREMFSDLL